jgi:hypothetical protein
MSLNCEIRFENNPEKIYYAGQDVSGVVICTVVGAYKVRSEKSLIFRLYYAKLS